MARTKGHPKRNKYCVFCKYWTGEADMKFINSTVGYEYEHDAKGKCMKKDCNMLAYSACQRYEPSIDAEKLL